MSRIKGIIDAVSDLAMDYQSRMARAKEQGFDTDTPYYHGSDDNIDAFDINKVGQNTITNTFPNGFWFSPEKKIAKGYGSNIHEVYLNKGVSNDGSLAGKDLFDAGVGDSVEYPRAIVLRDPSRIRSVDAAFDPAKKDSSNLLAGVTGAGLLGGSMVASEDADAGILSRIKAFHGSPHDFDRFSTKNIGTGEGAQAYGHGLYFAEREGTAQSYRDALSADTSFKKSDGAVFDLYDGSMNHPNIRRHMAKTGGDLDGAIEKAQKIIKDNSSSQSVDAATNDLSVLQKLKEDGGISQNKGSMYEVNIDASPDELLDYDVDLIDQSQKVKDGILKLGLTDLDGKKYSIQELDDLGHRGQTLYEKISGNAGADVASMRLKDVGIKGIKYADAQTRFSPKGRTNNYVMFDDKTIEIARKYGVSMPVAGAILAGTMTPEDAQASVPQAKDGLLKDTSDVLLETMAGVNRGVMDALNFVTTDQVNAISQLMGSDKRVPTLYDVPQIKDATSGNFMEKGALRQAVRQGSEFLSPI